MKKSLQTYFTSVKQAPQLLNSTDIRNLVETQSQGDLSNKISNPKRGFKTMNVINISLVAALGLSALFFQNGETPKAKSSGKSLKKSQNSAVSGFSKSSEEKKAFTDDSVEVPSFPATPATPATPALETLTIAPPAPAVPSVPPIPLIPAVAPKAPDVPGIRVIDLTKEEFAKLGIRVEGKQVVFFQNERIEVENLNSIQKAMVASQGIDLENPDYIAKNVIFMNGVSAGEIAKENDYKDIGIVKISPRVSTNYRNQKLMAMFWMSRDSAYKDMVEANVENLNGLRSFNALLPLRAIIKDPSSRNFKEAEVILWYEATQELIELLPERFKNPLLKEIAGTENPDEKIIAGETYFDTWRTSSGAILKTAVYPNPVREYKATLDFSLNEERIVTIVLHDIFGRKLAELRSAQTTPAGQYKWDMNLDANLANGMYLISVQTDKGEQAVQRVIIE